MWLTFKKPYGFLIRHFKLIHLVLTMLFVYLTVKVSGMLNYYKLFILGRASKMDAMGYVNNTYIIVVFISIVICVIMYILLKVKSKPRLFYLMLISFLGVTVIIIKSAYGGLEVIYSATLGSKSLLFYRDVLKILNFCQYIVICFVLVRGLGFDIKKFNFVKDLQELNIDVTDDEEVELSLEGTNVAKRKFNRSLREFRYYYLENKLFINIVFVVIFVCIFGAFFVHKEVVDKVYKEGEVVDTGGYQLRVVDTFITNRDYNNKTILNDDSQFVVVRMRLGSKGERKSFNTANLVLVSNYNNYVSDSYYGARFIDLGNSYRGQSLEEVKTYLFIYNVKNDDIRKNMKLVYVGDKVISLSPVLLDGEVEEFNYKLGQKFKLDNNVFGDGYLKIRSMEVKESFSFNYSYQIGGVSYTSDYSVISSMGAIIKLDIDSSYDNGLDDYSFFSTYGTLWYRINDEDKMVPFIENKTPGNYKDGLYLSIDKDAINADSIWFELIIRNKRFIYTIK